MAPPPLRPVHIGCLAFEALAASRGMARLVAALRKSAYLEAGPEIIWAGGGDALLHPRSVLLGGALPADWREVHFALHGLAPWRPAWPREIAGGPLALGERIERLAASLLAEATPRGLGVWLAGARAEFPLEDAALRIALLRESAAADNLVAGREAVRRLIGLGPGLTPSGDDFLAGFHLGLRLQAVALPARATRVEAWGELLRQEARLRAGRVSAAILVDATHGMSFAPAHALCLALASGEREGALLAARSLAVLGHSSGWDLLAGLRVGLHSD